MIGFPKYKNVTAPDLSNLIALQSQGASNAFNSLAGIGNTIQGIQQKNIDRDNRNLLAQAMQANLNRDPGAVNNIISQNVANTDLPLNQFGKLIGIADEQKKNELALKNQQLSYEIANSPVNKIGEIYKQNLDTSNLPLPTEIENNVLGVVKNRTNALSSYEDQIKLNQINTITDPAKKLIALNSLDPKGFNIDANINLLAQQQGKVTTDVTKQNQVLSNNDIEASIDATYNEKSPNYKPISFKGDTPEDITLNSFDDINNQSYELISQVQKSNLNPIKKQEAIAQIDTKTKIAKKRNLISLTENGYLDPSIYPQPFVDVGFSKAEIEDAYKNYNTKNINFGKDIDPINPIYPVLRGVQDTLTTYEAGKIKERDTGEYKLAESLQNAGAFKGDTSVDSINIFKKKYKDSVTEGQIRTAVDRIKAKTGNTLTLPEILSVIDYGAESTGYLELGSTSIDSWFADMFVNKDVKKFNPNMKAEILKNKEVNDQKDSKIKVKIQELQNLKKQFTDPTNKITKSVVKDKIEVISKEIQKLTNPEYSSEMLTKKITGN